MSAKTRKALRAPKKREQDKQVVPITVRFTATEIEAVRKKAGAAALAAYVRLAALQAGPLTAAA